jgi:tripartite-type tricarboxylate transporter receptor subunit TctC
MPDRIRLPALWGIVGSIVMLTTMPAFSDDQFFKGKTIVITTSAGAGGTHDVIARVLTRYMSKYLDGHPQMIVQNMPGGGNILATNYMYAIAPKDGTAIAVVSNVIPLHQVIDNRGVRYDAGKFNWLGSIGGKNDVVFAFRDAGVPTLNDLKKKELVLGGSGPGSNFIIIPTVMNEVLGTKFKIVMGYKSSQELFLAMDRGEIQARDGTYASIVSTYPEWLEHDKLVFFAQNGIKRDPALPNVPLLIELAKTEEERRLLTLIASPAPLGQPYLAPPGVAPNRVAALRKAFAESMKDKGLIAEAAKLKVDIDLVSGDEVAKIVKDTVETPSNVVEKARAVMGPAVGKGGD